MELEIGSSQYSSLVRAAQPKALPAKSFTPVQSTDIGIYPLERLFLALFFCSFVLGDVSETMAVVRKYKSRNLHSLTPTFLSNLLRTEAGTAHLQ